MIACYLRVSTSMQAEANGADAQRAAILAWLTAQGADPASVTWYDKDIGVSGAKASRESWDAMNKGIATGGVKTVLVYSLARLARRAGAMLVWFDGVRAKGVRVVSLKEAVDTETASGRMFIGMLAVFAEYEREVAAERTRDGIRAVRLKNPAWGAAKVRKGRGKGSGWTIPPESVPALYDLCAAEGRVMAVARSKGLPPTTLYKALQRHATREGLKWPIRRRMPQNESSGLATAV